MTDMLVAVATSKTIAPSSVKRRLIQQLRPPVHADHGDNR